jgi:hypothetical protein
VTTKARPDADRTAKPRTRLVAKLLEGEMCKTNATHYEGEDGQRVALTEPTKRNAPSALLAAVNAALRVIGSPGGAVEHADGGVWIDSLYVESDADAYYVMREGVIAGCAHSDQLGGGFYRSRGDAWAMRQAASALVREWVREQLDAWVSDDGKGE